MEYTKTTACLENLKKLNDSIATVIVRLNNEAVLLENFIQANKKYFSRLNC